MIPHPLLRLAGEPPSPAEAGALSPTARYATFGDSRCGDLPTATTINSSPDAPWRFRIFYDIDEGKAIVKIEAIGHKRGNRLYVRGDEFQL